nr:Gag-Pol polyprotein [Tanacetum cinerariifolium]
MFNKKKSPQSKTPKSRLQNNVSHLTPDPNFLLSGVSPPLQFASSGFEYQSQLPQPPQYITFFYQNRPFLPLYNNQNAFYLSPTGLYRLTMDSPLSSQANQPYSPLNRVNLDMDFEQLLNTQEYYQRQDYSMGQGSAYGSAPVDDDDSPVEEMSPVKKPSKRASRANKNDAKDKELAKDWTKAKEIALCQGWCDVSENSEKRNSMKVKGFWEAVINYFKKETNEYEEAQEHRSLGRDAAKANKKSFASFREGSSSFVDLVADKYLGIKSTKWEKMQEQQDSYIQLKNRVLDIQKAARKEAAKLKKEKLEIQRFSTLTPLSCPNVGELPPITASTFITRSSDNTPLVHRASTSANPDPVISPAFVEANYEVLESLLRDRRRQVRNEDLRTKFDYYSEEYDEEKEMEPRPARVREATLALQTGSSRIRRHRGRVVEFEEASNRDGSMVERESDGRRPSERRVEEGGSHGVNLPLLLVAHLGRNENMQPLYSTLTSVYGGNQPSTNLGGNLPPHDSTGCVTHFVHWIKDYPLPDGLKIPSYVGSYDGKGDPDNYLHLFEDLPTTYKGLMEKTYTWIEAKVVSTNGAPNDHKEGFDKFNKGSSWHNNKGRKKNWDRFSLCKGSNHGLLVNLSKSQREILATENAAKAFEQPPRMEAVKSGQLAHLVKCLKKGKAKAFDTQLGEWKKGDKGIARAKAPILMVNRESHTPKRKSTEESINGTWEITFPSVLGFDNSSDLVIIKLKPSIRSFRVDSKILLVGFLGEHSWTLGEVPLEVTMGESPYIRTKTLNFVIVRSNSPYNLLLGRTTMHKIGIVVSMIYAVITFHTPRGIGIVFSTYESNKVEEEQKKVKEITPERLRSINIKLNPKKCSFDVEDGPFLGNLITKYEIKANPLKVKAITDLKPPTTLKEIQSLNGKLAALSQFYSKGVDSSLPFFKVLKSCINKKKIQWTIDAEEAFQRMKEFIEMLPTLTAPIKGEVLMKAILRKDKCLAAIGERPAEVTDDSKWDETDGNAIANLHLALADGDAEASVASHSPSHRVAVTWHKLGHMSEEGIQILVERKLFPGLTKAPVQSLGGAKYFVSFLDDYSRRCWVYPIKKKSVVFEVFKRLQMKAGRDLQIWLFDTGATYHMTARREWFHQYKPISEGGSVYSCNDHELKIIGIGSIMVKMHDGEILEDAEASVASHSPSHRVAVTWHQKLGHMLEQGMKILVERKVLPGLTKVSLPFCKHYVISKQHRLKFKTSNSRSVYVLELVRSDVRQAPVQSLGGAKRCWVYPIKKKSVVFEVFKVYKAWVELDSRKKIKCLRTDNGSERMNRTLLERARAMLVTTSLGKSFWAEAVNTACYVINRAPSTAVELKTPMEMWTGKPSNDSFEAAPQHEVDELNESQAPATRTLNRKRRRPGWHSDYVMKNNIAYCLLTEEGEPSTLQEALTNPDASFWKEAIKEEIEALYKNKTWELAPRCWYKRFDSFIKSVEYSRLHADPCAYFKREFEMKDLRPANKILGMQIHRDRVIRKIWLSQRNYVKKILQRFNIQDCKPISSPFLTNVKLSSKMSPSSEKERMKMSRVPYASAVGSLMFAMICTRPNIAHAVGVMSRDSDLIVNGYVDSDYAGDFDGNKSTTGKLDFKLQSVVAMSTIEAEYVAAAQAINMVEDVVGRTRSRTRENYSIL